MSDIEDHPLGSGTLETTMRMQVARGDAVAREARPILRHLLGQHCNDLFSEEIVARVKGMVRSLSGSLLDGIFFDEPNLRSGHQDDLEADLGQLLIADETILSHIHATALEYQLTDRLQGRLSLDAVTSPLVRDLIASSDPQLQSQAMAYLAAQARWCQSQRRMSLTPAELPQGEFDIAIAALRGLAAESAIVHERLAGAIQRAEAARGAARSRIELASSLVQALPEGPVRGLSIEHAGVALFTTALALAVREARDATVFSLHGTQAARLALSLRAAGLRPAAVELQFVMIHPELPLPSGLETLGADRACALLADSGGAMS